MITTTKELRSKEKSKPPKELKPKEVSDSNEINHIQYSIPEQQAEKSHGMGINNKDTRQLSDWSKSAKPKIEITIARTMSWKQATIRSQKTRLQEHTGLRTNYIE